MGLIVNIYGATKTIIIDDDTSIDVVINAQELYSRWKEWILTNPQWEPAFRTFGGDPLGGGTFAGDFYFINNNAGWKIKPAEKHHTLTINGNLFAENTNLPLFVTTTGNFIVNIRQGFSSLTQTVQSGSGLSVEQQTKLDELHKIHGLNTSHPLKVNKTSRVAEGAGISQTISQELENVTVTRD